MIRLFRFLKPYTSLVILVFVLTFLQAISQLFLPNLMSNIVDIGIVNGDTGYILRMGLFMLMVAAVGALCTIGTSYLSAKTSAGYGQLLRSKVFERVESFSLHEFDQIGTASLITRTTNDITQIQHVVVMVLRMMISAPMMGIGGIVMAVSKDVKLSLVLLVSMPVLTATVLTIANKGVPLFKVIQEKLDKLNLVLREGLTGIRVIRAFNRGEHEKQRFGKANYDLTSTAIKVNKVMAAMHPAMSLILNATIIAIIWFGGIRVDQGSMQVGDLMAFIQYVMQIMFSLVMVSMMFVMLPRAAASAARVNEVLDTVPEIKDAEVVRRADSKRGYIEFQSVTFHYPGAEQPAVRDITFQAGPGEVTAIIGGTGSGKSTLLNLIPRFYDVDDGSILVDGVDIREMSQTDLRAKIGLVSQTAVLFTGSVADNIRYGREDATLEEVDYAAQVAQASEFITTMPDEFDTQIAQGGTNVSGGQKQRISIARALVRRPDIYLFDDSFSALDYKTDAKLRAALREEIQHSTVLIVAQRVSTVMGADRIIVLEDGAIAGMGTHRELLATCSVYREIVSSQLSEEELA